MITTGTVGSFVVKVGLSIHTGSRDGCTALSASFADNDDTV